MADLTRANLSIWRETMSESVTLAVTGMKCSGCESTVRTALDGIEGVSFVNASHQDKQVKVDYDPSKVDVEEIIEAIVEAGFKVAE